jgi:hypothetical protein
MIARIDDVENCTAKEERREHFSTKVLRPFPLWPEDMQATVAMLGEIRPAVLERLH